MTLVWIVISLLLVVGLAFALIKILPMCGFQGG